MERLEPFIGEWSVETSLAPPGEVVGRTVFEWMLGGQFMAQRTEVPHPDAPDSVVITGRADAGDAYTQHYFDSRGVARVYAMTFRDGVWTLLRDTPDFTPLSFSQRFTGTFSDGGDTIAGQWESSHDGANWELDFTITYTRRQT